MRHDAAQGAPRERGLHRRAWLHGMGALCVALVFGKAWQPLPWLRKRRMPPSRPDDPTPAATAAQPQAPTLPRWIGHC